MRALANVLALLLVLLPLGCGRDRPGQQPALGSSAPPAPLQEVAPPAGVQQLAAALADHSPQLRILAPADGATLPDGPWTLRLQVRDWPMTDAGELGLGPHVVVQLDDEPPQRLAQASDGANTTDLNLEMAALRPGSHRLTVYAARPWGEAVKSPGAFRQIQLQRVAATPLRVPAPGTPQLIGVNPGPEPRPEPVLLDWLLLDAPLQGLRAGDASWRLRVSVNGDSFLVDHNSPLWLRGWHNGSNSLQLDLVDGLGDPLNPPFNSLVSEVVIQANAPRPPWLSRLEPDALARLLGQAPAEPQAGAEPRAALQDSGQAVPEPQALPPAQPEPSPQPTSQPSAPAADLDNAAAGVGATDPGTRTDPETRTDQETAADPGPSPDPAPRESPAAQATQQPLSPSAPQAPAAQTGAPAPPPAEPVPAPAEPPRQPPAPSPDRIAPSTSLSGSAREQVRDDGSLIQPRGRGPLSGLRERLGA